MTVFDRFDPDKAAGASETDAASDESSEIPFERLPDGFAEPIRSPGIPRVPRPAATVVLMRPGEKSSSPGNLEILLLKRVRSAGFVPGAYVFPGGRVDAEDGSAALIRRLRAPDRAEGTVAGPDRDSRSNQGPTDGDVLAPYLVAAIREAFEETGILLALDPGGDPSGNVADDPKLAESRRRLLAGELSFAALLHQERLRMDAASVGYIAHWITPEAEPRRYDTRFFAAAVPAGTPVTIHEAEASDALWIGPSDALRRHHRGELPMIFPTIRTLEALRDLESPEAVLEHYRHRRIPAILPRLVRTATGVAIRLPDEE